MATRIDSVSDMGIKCIFSVDEIDMLKEIGCEYALWEDDRGVDMKLSHLFFTDKFFIHVRGY